MQETALIPYQKHKQTNKQTWQIQCRAEQGACGGDQCPYSMPPAGTDT